MKAAIFGGTFDPPHLGHRSYYLNSSFDSFIVIPTGTPPHKELRPNSASAAQRLEMARLTFPECEVSDIELLREGKSYTADTVRELMRLYPDTEFTLLMGTDMFESLDKWWDIDWLRRNVEFRCLDRSVIPISSSELRELLPLRKGREFLTPEVYAYIIKHRLYGAKPDFDWLRLQASQWMGGKRMEHTLGVEAAAVTLAKRYGADEEEAGTAAILHDITKLKNFKQHLTYLQMYDIIPKVQDTENEKILHSLTGAEAAYHEFGVSEAVRDAIRWHTTGRAHMSLLEKIIYLADAIEEARHYAGVEQIRELAFVDIDRAILLSLGITVAELREAGAIINPASEEALDYFTRITNKSEDCGF